MSDSMKVVLFAMGAGIAWGSGQILVKFGMRTVDAITGIAIRLTTAWLTAMVILFISRIGHWEGISFNPKGAMILALEGIVGPMLGMFLVLAAYRAGGEVKTAILVLISLPNRNQYKCAYFANRADYLEHTSGFYFVPRTTKSRQSNRYSDGCHWCWVGSIILKSSRKIKENRNKVME